MAKPKESHIHLRERKKIQAYEDSDTTVVDVEETIPLSPDKYHLVYGVSIYALEVVIDALDKVTSDLTSLIAAHYYMDSISRNLYSDEEGRERVLGLNVDILRPAANDRLRVTINKVVYRIPSNATPSFSTKTRKEKIS